MAKTLGRHIRIGEDHWRRIEAQAIARDMQAAGRGDEIAEIARNISNVAPEMPSETDESE